MSDIISEMKNPDDIKKLDEDSLETLSKELREEIINTVSNNGGHLSSNLGVIELTIALLRKFDLCEDKIVWDVGHQTYAYKILTGRYTRFCTIRQLGGLAGFPKRCESKYDYFNTGHSSTSISAALGMLRANRIKGKKNKVIAVIGDGALTGGMSFEALNDAGQSNIDLIVILNDNQMSINNNVGGMAKHLDNIRISSKYLKIKSKTHTVMKRTKIGSYAMKKIELAKAALRQMIRRQKVFFEDLGFNYYGPIDGHDISEIEKHLDAAKRIQGPVLIHVITQKGKGYEYAEVSPDKYHGVPPFEVSNGQSKKIKEFNPAEFASFSQAFGHFLTDFAMKDDKILAVSAAMATGTGLDEFKLKYPERFFDVGIAEQHAITMAAGMACEGLKPVVAIYSTFLQRAYDQLLHDVALQNLHVVVCIDRAGVVGEDGETHQGIYDLGLFMTMPGMVILSPRDFRQLKKMLKFALDECTGPVALRYPRGSEKVIEGIKEGEEETNLIEPEIILEGKDLTFIAEGPMVQKAYNVCKMLEKDGYRCELIDIRMIKPFKSDIVEKSAAKTKKVVVMENALIDCGLGTMIEDFIMSKGIDSTILKIGVKDHALVHGTPEELFRLQEMDEDSV